MKGDAQSLRRHLGRFDDLLFRRGGALGEQRDALEQVHGAVELRVPGVEHSFPFLFLEALYSAGGLPHLNVMLLLIGQRDDDVRVMPSSWMTLWLGV